MSRKSVYKFIRNNSMTDENEKFVNKCLMELESDAWGKGYQARIDHSGKHKLLKKERFIPIVKRFLDFLSDKTHNPKKA